MALGLSSPQRVISHTENCIYSLSLTVDIAYHTFFFFVNQPGLLVIDGVLSLDMLERFHVKVKKHYGVAAMQSSSAYLAFCIVFWRKF
jgi:hypothetical protein